MDWAGWLIVTDPARADVAVSPSNALRRMKRRTGQPRNRPEFARIFPQSPAPLSGSMPDPLSAYYRVMPDFIAGMAQEFYTGRSRPVYGWFTKEFETALPDRGEGATGRAAMTAQAFDESRLRSSLSARGSPRGMMPAPSLLRFPTASDRTAGGALSGWPA